MPTTPRRTGKNAPRTATPKGRARLRLLRGGRATRRAAMEISGHYAKRTIRPEELKHLKVLRTKQLGPVVAQWLEEMRSEDPWRRGFYAKFAAERLRDSGRGNLIESALMNMLKKDASPRARADAGNALVFVKPSIAGTQALVEALKDPDAHVRGQAASTLGHWKAKAAAAPLRAALETALKANDHQVVGDACTALGHIGDKEAIPLLMRATKEMVGNENWYTRGYAVYGLGHIPGPEAVDALIKLTKSEQPDVRETAVHWLWIRANPGKVAAMPEMPSDPRAVPALREVAGNRRQPQRVREDALLALSRLGEKAA